MVLRALIVFMLAMATDFIWVQATREITRPDPRPVVAGCLSVLLAVPSLFSFVQVSEDTVLAAPYMAGLFIGTVLTVRHSKKYKADGNSNTDQH